jgi:hypothetical protein
MKSFLFSPFAILSVAATIWIGSYLDPIQDKLILHLQQWYKTYPQEKVFVQVNRQQLVAGEQMWFKGWCTFLQKPSFLSRIVYTDIVNEEGQVVEKNVYKLDSLGSWHGHIDISRKWKSGNYTLRAYTAWMLNQPEYIFQQPFFVYGEDEVNRINNTISKKLNMQFFPEGGQWIVGVENKMAFVVQDEMGLPVNTPITIKDGNRNTVTSASVLHQGMGMFKLTPKQETYTAEIQTANGAVFTFSLPPVQQEGVQLIVQNTTSNRMFVSVQRGEKFNEKYSRLLIMAHMSGQLVYSTYLDFEEGLTTAPIPKKNLPPGIIQITVMDTLGTPLAERLAFIENYTIHRPKLSFEKKQTDKRSENIWQLKADSLFQASLSVLVNNSAVDGKIGLENSIASHLLLTSDIKGYVHEPGFYFQNKSPETLEKLDLLMMVHGWRKFTWKQILQNEAPVLRYPIESNLQIKGIVTKSDRKEVVKDGKVSFVIKGEDSVTYIIDAYLTDKGEFIVDSLNIRDKATVSYLATNNKKENLVVDVKFYPTLFDTLEKATLNWKLNLDTLVLANRKSKLAELLYGQLSTSNAFTGDARYLGNVTVTAKKMNRIDSLQSSYVTAFFEISDQTLEVPQDRGFMNIWQFLQREVVGINVNPFETGGVRSVTFNRFSGMVLGTMNEDGSMSGGADDGVQFFLNELPVSTDIIDALNPDEVALVKIYKGATAFPFGANAGAIGIYTKKGRSISANQRMFNSFEKKGFTMIREFYHVDYKKMPDYNKMATDKRTTLYWNPKAKFNDQGQLNIRFFNSDITQQFKITAQGIDQKGRFIFFEELVN